MSESNRNEITGDLIKTKGVTTNAYRDSWERIFGSKSKAKRVALQQELPVDTYLSPCCKHEEESQKEIQKEQCHSSGCCGECN